MRTPHALVLLAAIAFFGGVLLALVATARALLGRYRPAPLSANRSERWTLGTAVAAAVVGALWLMVVPFGSEYAGSGSLSSVADGSTVSAPLPMVKVARPLVALRPNVVALLVLPVLIALAPFALARRGGRPIVQGLCAMLLGAYVAISPMTGVGAFFAPSGVLMLAAGLFASSSRAARKTR